MFSENYYNKDYIKNNTLYKRPTVQMNWFLPYMVPQFGPLTRKSQFHVAQIANKNERIERFQWMFISSAFNCGQYLLVSNQEHLKQESSC